ncbi:MAG: TetR/AcrR family transcriptional regulator [Acidimicrobiales bacterium]
MGTALVDRLQSGASVGLNVRERDLGPGAAEPGNPPSPQAGGSRARVTSAALGCIGRYGLSKTTLDDIAREARLSRATLYRAFPGGRDEILAAVLRDEVERYFAELAEAISGTSELSELLARALTAAAEQISRHEALRFLLKHEPGVILPHVSFRRFDGVLGAAVSFFGPYLAPVLGGEEASRVAEWMARLVVSHVLCPPGAADVVSIPGMRAGAASVPFALHPEPIGQEQAVKLVTQFVMPGIKVLTSARPALAGMTSND